MQEAPDQVTQGVQDLLKVGMEVGPFVFRVLLLVVVALIVSKFLGHAVGYLLLKMNVPERRTLLPVTAVRLGVLLVAALLALRLLGFPAMTVLRVLVALALVLIVAVVVFRPFLPKLPLKEGDLIEQGPIFGTVDSITFAHTIFRTIDGNTAFVPNHKLLNEPLTNYTVSPTRRADVDFDVTYDEDLDRVQSVVLAALQKDERVLEEPAPVVAIKEMEPSYRSMVARFWLASSGYVGARWAAIEAIDRALTANGIQRGVPRLKLVETSADQPTGGRAD